MKLFNEVAIGEVFVVAGGFELTKDSATTARFEDAPNVGSIPHSATEQTFTVEEFNNLPVEAQVEAIFA